MQNEIEEFDLHPETGPWAPVRLADGTAPGHLPTASLAVRLMALATAVLAGASLLKLAVDRSWL